VTTLNNSIIRGLTILECLFEEGFEGKTLDEIFTQTDIPWTTSWRMLKTMEAKGWVVEVPIGGSKQGRWRASSKIVEIANAYERNAIAKVQGIKNEFSNMTGRELKA